MRWIEKFHATVRMLSRITGVAAALMLVVAVLVICQSIVVRYFAGGSSTWQTEFVTYLLIASTFLGSPYVLLTKGHVNIALLSERMKGRSKTNLRLVSDLVVFAVLAVLAWTAFGLFHEAWEKNWKSETVAAVRLWIPYGGMATGLVLLALQGLSGLLGHLVPGEREGAP